MCNVVSAAPQKAPHCSSLKSQLEVSSLTLWRAHFTAEIEVIGVGELTSSTFRTTAPANVYSQGRAVCTFSVKIRQVDLGMGAQMVPLKGMVKVTQSIG